MKLSEFAKKNSIQYQAAYKMYKSGLISGYQLPTGTIVITESSDETKKEDYTVLYARVSSSENKSNLDNQAERLKLFAIANGWKIDEIVKECGSGLNDHRPKLEKIFRDKKATRLIVEHADRLTRFGFNYLKILCDHLECELIVINQAEDEKSDLIQDFISIITSFCARIYGQRRCKRKIEKLIEELNNKND